jgi:hypothetical protein
MLLSAALAVPGVVALQSPAQAATGPGVDDIFTVEPDVARQIDLLANDTANAHRFREGTGQASDPAHGTITPTFGSGKAAPTYTPDADFIGIDTVNYTAIDDDSGVPYTATARIVVGDEPCTDAAPRAGYTVQVFTPTGTDTQTVTIPVDAAEVTVSMCGAQGGPTPRNGSYAQGGPGGFTEATLNNGAPLTADLDLSVVPGAAGDNTAGRHAVGGGGAGQGGGQGGGGASLLYATSDLTSPLLVAGGGGGAGTFASACVDGGNGGVGGGLEGGDGLPYFPYNPSGASPCSVATSAPVGNGGTQSAGGTSPVPGGDGTFKYGGDATGTAGGGGGGWYGGGAGSPSTDPGNVDAPGGGGSGHVASGGPLAISGMTLGNGHLGDGAVRISYLTIAPPAFTSASISDSPTAGVSYSRTVTTSGGPHPAITFDTLPPGLTYVDNGNGSATISGTPTTPGTYDFTATADNGQPPPATQAERIEVLSAPPPPPPPPSPSPSASASASPTASLAVRRTLSLTASRPDILPGQLTPLTAVGQAGQAIELRCYTRPSTLYFTARTATINASGAPVTFELRPGANTRCFVQYAANPASGASPSLVINVHTALSLSAVRTGLRTYRFQGRNLPRLAGQLVTIYRVDSQGREIRTANAKTDSSGTYYVPAAGLPGRTFTGTGTFDFIARTSATLTNAAGSSSHYHLTIR